MVWLTSAEQAKQTAYVGDHPTLQRLDGDRALRDFEAWIDALMVGRER